jgi:hypothetical protein
MDLEKELKKIDDQIRQKKSRKNKKKKLVKVLEENPTLKDSLGGQLKVGRPR